MKPKSYLDVPEEKRVRMSELQSQLLLKLFIAERESDSGVLDFNSLPTDGMFGMVSDEFCPKVLARRLAVMAPQVQITASVWAFLGLISNSPGDAVTWAYTLYCLWERSSKAKPISLETLSVSFPFGFPSTEGSLEIWDAQKCDRDRDSPASTDNLLDRASTWS